MTRARLRRGWWVPPSPRGDLFFGATSRILGDMKAPGMFARALRERGFPADGWAGGTQVHRDRIRWIRSASAPREHPSTDGLATDRRAMVLRIFTADCVPALLAGPRGTAVALLHAGWRGARAGILTRAVRLLARRGLRPEQLSLRLGPHIGPCCYEVGEEVIRAFARVPRAFRNRRSTTERITARFSLGAALREEARRAGIPARRIRTRAPCTACDRRFHSYRRDRTPERQAAVAVIL
jgi:YfiH family protein